MRSPGRFHFVQVVSSFTLKVVPENGSDAIRLQYELKTICSLKLQHSLDRRPHKILASVPKLYTTGTSLTELQGHRLHQFCRDYIITTIGVVLETDSDGKSYGTGGVRREINNSFIVKGIIRKPGGFITKDALVMEIHELGKK
jgi:hypothetical protein